MRGDSCHEWCGGVDPITPPQRVDRVIVAVDVERHGPRRQGDRVREGEAGEIVRERAPEAHDVRVDGQGRMDHDVGHLQAPQDDADDEPGDEAEQPHPGVTRQWVLARVPDRRCEQQQRPGRDGNSDGAQDTQAEMERIRVP